MTYRAVVKYPVDATDKEKRQALWQGLQDIAAELVEEHGFTLDQIDRAFEEARWTAEETHAVIDGARS